MGEIGSEFWDVPMSKEKNNIFPDSAQWFLSGRSALTGIIRKIKDKRNIHTVSMPSWCCDSMIIPFLREKIEVQFYPVYWEKALVQEINKDSDIVFVMDYFGYTSNYTISHPCVIRDVTHSIFSHQYDDAKYYFGSLRKWCGVKTGGYAWDIKAETVAADQYFINMRTMAMQRKKMYLSGKIREKDYLTIFNDAEERLDNLEGVFEADGKDVEIAQYLDVSHIREQRRNNAVILMNAFADCLLFPDLSENDCPMFVPILVADGKRDQLRQYLIKQGIYCPVHWPVSQYHRLNEQERKIYDNELSLVCDQRYDKRDMLRIVEAVKNFQEEK